MKSLDQILSEYIDSVTGFRNSLLQHLNVAEWTVDTRDEKMDIIRQFSSDSSLASYSLIKYLVDTEYDGHPLIYWVMYREALSAELEFLIKMREDLDITVDEAIQVLPVDYEWVTSKIRKLIEELTILSENLEPILESPGTAEEV